jgi:hypothetical protein
MRLVNQALAAVALTLALGRVGPEKGAGMRSVLGFLSMVAIGLMLAVVVTFVVVGLAADPAQSLTERGPRLDFVSLALGLGLGLTIGNLGRIGWAELPRRAASWLLTNERNFYRVVWAAVLLGILLYY